MSTPAADAPQRYPLLVLRDRVLFPGIVLRLTTSKRLNVRPGSREPSLVAISARPREESAGEGGEGEGAECYDVGVLCRLVRVAPGQHRGTYDYVIQGAHRVKVEPVPGFAGMDSDAPSVTVRGHPRGEELAAGDAEGRALSRRLKSIADEMFALISPNLAQLLSNAHVSMGMAPPSVLVDILAAYSGLAVSAAQQVLEEDALKPRMKLVVAAVTREREERKLSSEIDQTVKSELTKSQREFLLRQQLKAISKQLGEEGEESTVSDIAAKLEALPLPPNARTAVERELRRIKQMSPSSAEWSVILQYLETLAELPWTNDPRPDLDIGKARVQLDNDHHGLEKVKRRVLESLAVSKLRDDMKGTILCLVGPPGVGKTSLASSVALATGRKFARLSLGGVHDEAEIRGHRRTYVGAMPGALIRAIIRAGSSTPLVLLDEIDKLGGDRRGDPASALLEVLDPEQNHAFNDHYVALPWDLSKCMFIATANSLDSIPAPLIDRMEIVELSGYTLQEKIAIARDHLVPKQIALHGLDSERLAIGDEVVMRVIQDYTFEPGVRSLQRHVAAICRRVALEGADAGAQAEPTLIGIADLEQILGPPRFANEEIFERTLSPGVATGLARTQVGGAILFVEAALYGPPGLTITGTVGEVMRESAATALGYLRSLSAGDQSGGHYAELLSTQGLHLHFPAGAVPKDGPSAGCAIIAATVSLLRGACFRSDTAVTGEIALLGSVLPVGGIKEKVLAAHHAGLERVVLPRANERDVLYDVPETVRDDVKVIYVETVDELLREVLVHDASGGVDLPRPRL